MLREQLVAANDANADLADDLRKVTEDWNMMKEEMREKEAGWKEDQKVWNVLKIMHQLRICLLHKS